MDADWRSERFGQRCRLQMFKPSPSLTDTSDEENNIKDVWNWWRSGKRAKYPSTLWVTVEPVMPPSSSEPTLRSMVPTQPEMGQQLGMALDNISNGQVGSSDQNISDMILFIYVTRKKTQHLSPGPDYQDNPVEYPPA